MLHWNIDYCVHVCVTCQPTYLLHVYTGVQRTVHRTSSDATWDFVCAPMSTAMAQQNVQTAAMNHRTVAVSHFRDFSFVLADFFCAFFS